MDVEVMDVIEPVITTDYSEVLQTMLDNQQNIIDLLTHITGLLDGIYQLGHYGLGIAAALFVLWFIYYFINLFIC